MNTIQDISLKRNIHCNVKDDFSFLSHGESAQCDSSVSLLSLIADAVKDNSNLSLLFSEILKILKENIHVSKATINLYNKKTDKIFIYDSIGMSDDEVDNNVCYIDEGIIGKVIKSGQKKISFHRHDQSGCKERIIESERANESHLYIICIPIIKGDDILGAIYLEKIYDNASVLKHETEQIEIIAVMIAQAVELYLLDNHTNSFLQKENERLKAVIKDKFKPSNIIGNSKPMLDIYALLNRYAATKTDILILGENGVGKELIGSILHYNGPQSNEPFIKIDCGSQLDFLMEREIFGYDKNAFEGAMHNFKGAFEQAEGGTLYFENIEELSEEIQFKLLRVLKERSFERVGGSKTLKADVRIIVASDKDLKYLVEEGTLIKELFSKLTENVIKVPALRERNNDIITLAESFINRFSSKLNKEIKRISTPVQEMLMSYSWPGNVRELETVIERAVILTEDNVIHAYDLPLSLQTPILSSTSFKKGLVAKLDSIEYEMIIEALKNHKGNISTAAEDLGLSRRMLSLRMDKFNIVYKKYRGE